LTPPCCPSWSRDSGRRTRNQLPASRTSDEKRAASPAYEMPLARFRFPASPPCSRSAAQNAPGGSVICLSCTARGLSRDRRSYRKGRFAVTPPNSFGRIDLASRFDDPLVHVVVEKRRLFLSPTLSNLSCTASRECAATRPQREAVTTLTGSSCEPSPCRSAWDPCREARWYLAHRARRRTGGEAFFLAARHADGRGD
jgi:hypothetical protein